tara:strand:- start:34 stop:384 length:351 start_codon:yes stop_codon:yes gene_type:complete
MNINEYIENYSTVDVDKATGIVTVTMEVPPRKQITYKHQECEASQRVKVRTNDVQVYLVNSGIEILSSRTNDSIDNNNKLTAQWEYDITPISKKSKKNKRREYTEETISKTIEDIS